MFHTGTLTLHASQGVSLAVPLSENDAAVLDVSSMSARFRIARKASMQTPLLAYESPSSRLAFQAGFVLINVPPEDVATLDPAQVHLFELIIYRLGIMIGQADGRVHFRKGIGA